MNYAIVRDNAIITTGDAKRLWPNVSFPSSGPNAEFLVEQDATVIVSAAPHDPATQGLRKVEPYLLDGVVYDRAAVNLAALPPRPRWQEFAAALVMHPEVGPMVESFLDALATSRKGLQGMIYVGMGQAAQGDGQTFGTAWDLATAAGFVSPELAVQVQGIAASCDLPASFVEKLSPRATAEG